MKKQSSIIAALGVAIALLALWLVARKAPRPTAPLPEEIARAELATRVATQPPPRLASASAIVDATPEKAAAEMTPTDAPPPAASPKRLDEEELAPLRAAFEPPRFEMDASIPRQRQTLLSNRLLIAPETRTVAADVSGSQTPTPRGSTPFIVQLNRPVSDATRSLLTTAGATVRGYLPNNAVLAELTPEALKTMAKLSTVQAVDEYLPSDKLQPFLSYLVASQPAESEIRVTLQTFAPEDVEIVAAAVRKLEGSVEATHAGTRWGTVKALLPLGAAKGVASLGAVQWIEESPEIKTRNDRSAQSAYLNVVEIWDTWQLTGKGQIVGHADTGLDTGQMDSMHPDFADRLKALIARARPGDASDLHGHGTHTAGSILGSGAASGGLYRGIAHEARLIHQSVVAANGQFTGLGADLYPVFHETLTNGATIHSDSWGSPGNGNYDTDCRSCDLFTWDHPEMLLVFAAGNDGVDHNPTNGVVDNAAISSPASAKNVLAVGATEIERPLGSGGLTGRTWGSAWPAKYPLNPIKNDYLSQSADTEEPSRQGMAAYSSRGPSRDGRVKPEIVAPGVNIISTKSAVGGSQWGLLAGNNRYCFNGGTSMATPLAAGCAALARQYCVERAGITNPTAALVKAMLAGGARSLAPGQYGAGDFQEIPLASPNNVEGWGQVDVGATLHPTNASIMLHDRIAVQHGATNTFELTILHGDRPLDIALCWLDYPATPAAAVTLVNDLDLLVEAPGGALLHPNGSGARDATNTLESVRLAAAAPGLYRLHVIGANVPYPGGVAALYARGAFRAAPVIVHTPVTAQIASQPEHAIPFHVQSLDPLTNAEARVFWTSQPMPLDPQFDPLVSPFNYQGQWQSVTALWQEGGACTASLPAMAAATRVYYYIEVEDDDMVRRLPLDAPNSVYAFHVDNLATLTVSGFPDDFGVVEPPYGTNTLIANTPFTASAPETVALDEGDRRVCTGWSGTGDLPAAGDGNSATLAIGANSTLTWHWATEYRLAQSLALADTNIVFGQTSTWHRAGTGASTVAAPELVLAGDTPYAFCGWYVDDERWPDASASAPNPATGIVMRAVRSAQGDYLPFWRDSDNDNLSDWWEQRYFGSITNDTQQAGDDPDGDGWTNLAEFWDNTDPTDPQSTPEPPVITFTPLAPFQQERPPWEVRATVTDNFNVEEVFLVWREKGDASWRYTPMTWQGEDTFTALLEPPSHGAKRVDYHIYAADLLGYYLPELATTSAVHSVIGDYDSPWMEVTPLDPAPLELSTAPTNITFSVANLAGPDLVWTARVAGAAATFDPFDPGWRHSGTNDAWITTSNRLWGGQASWYCGNSATRTYPNDCHAVLDTPPFTVGAGGGLLFRHWLQNEFDEGAHYWDGAVIRLSLDGGTTFTLIEPVSGYPGKIAANPASPFPPDHPSLGGDGDGWETLVLDLAAHAGQSAIVRFEFGSDSYVVEEGWYIAGVTPFSQDETAPWLTPQGAWGGILPDLWSADFSLVADPAAISYDDEVFAFIRVTGNDPACQPLIPLTMRRGRRILIETHGPGTAAAERYFLFRENSSTTVSVEADPNCYILSLLINGQPYPGVYDHSLTRQSIPAAPATGDWLLQAWFALKSYPLTIVSSQGSPIPPSGTACHEHGTSIGAMVYSPMYVMDGLRWRCTGWTLTGHEPAQGSENWINFTLTNSATLTWRWTEEARLSAGAFGDGTVAPTGGWYTAGSAVTVTALPSAYHHFDRWNGNVVGATLDGPLFSCVLTLPCSVTATFLPNLTQTRGVPEWWLAQHGWTSDFEAAAEADTDGDGMPAWAEWRADTNPTNPHSLLAVTALAQDSGIWHLRWIGGIKRTQFVQRATSPAGPWLTIHTNLPPTAITNTLTLPQESGGGFFRIAL